MDSNYLAYEQFDSLDGAGAQFLTSAMCSLYQL